MSTTKHQTYKDRVAGKHLFSFSSHVSTENRESHAVVINCQFENINRDDNTAICSFNERDDGKGMSIHMENVKVVPIDTLCITDLPKWIVKFLKYLKAY